jgi:hypothetical protein
MSEIVKGIIISMGSTIVCSVCVWLWVRSSTGGKIFWKNLGRVEESRADGTSTFIGTAKGVRTIAVITAVALVLALSAVIAFGLLSREATQLTFITGVGSDGFLVDGGNYRAVASCQNEYTVINAECDVYRDKDNPSGDGYLQSRGLYYDSTQMKYMFDCQWSGIKKPTTFKAWIAPVCAAVTKK